MSQILFVDCIYRDCGKYCDLRREEPYIYEPIVRSMIAEFIHLRKNLHEDYESLQITLRILLYEMLQLIFSGFHRKIAAILGCSNKSMR